MLADIIADILVDELCSVYCDGAYATSITSEVWV
jgi:hypothetical protein